MDKLNNIKQEKDKLEEMLLSKKGDAAANEAYEALIPYFEKVDAMVSYQPLGRLRLVRLFLETDLSKDQDLFSCYGRFANLVEGVEV